MKINKIDLNVPYKTKKLVKKTVKEFKQAGQKDVLVKVNKKGNIAVLGYKTPERDELTVSSVITPDGAQKMIYYYNYPAEKPTDDSVKIVEVWDRIKDGLIFNKSITSLYGKSKTPKVVSTMKTDANLDDGVEIVKQYPLDKYMSIFRRPK